SCRDDYKLRANGAGDGRYAESGAKRVLIKALSDVLPADIGSRPKRGFALPLVQWLRSDLRELLLETCHPETVAGRGLIDPQAIEPLVATPQAIAANLHPRLWSLMVFEMWCRSALDVPLTVSPGSPAIRPLKLAE